MEYMTFVAEDPSQPGAAWAICADDPRTAKNPPKCIAEWIRLGAIVRRVPIDTGIEMFKKWVRPEEKHG